MVDVVVTAESERYDSSSPAWLAQVAGLRTELMRASTGFRIDSARVEDTKGTLDTVVLALTSTGALSAATTCFRAWLARDKTRTVEVSWTEDGHQQRFVLTADAMDTQSAREVMRALGRRIEREKEAE